MKRGLLLIGALPLLLAADGALPQLGLPIACKLGQDCAIQHYVDVDPSPGVRDYACGRRTYDKHDGIDFRIPSMAAARRGVSVLAAADGTVRNMRDGMDDVSVRVAGPASVADKECGNGVVIMHGADVETQYCHLLKGSVAVKPGQIVKAGTVLGKVGMSGDAEFPHLHFTVRRAGKAIDPFALDAAPGSCRGGRSLWSPAAGLGNVYRAGTVINAGFAAGPVTMDQLIQNGDHIPKPDRSAPALVAFAQAIGLEKGDVQRIAITAPDGSAFAENQAQPLDNDKAQYMLFTGKKLRGAQWPAGRYTARYVVTRQGRPVVDQSFTLQLG